MAKAISDEQIIAALLSNGTLKAAAQAVGIGERTIYERMNNGEFAALYKAAKADIVRQAVYNLNSKLNAAIDTVAEVMNNQQNNAAVRLQAAQTIINSASKFAARLADDEQAVTAQIEADSWSIV